MTKKLIPSIILYAFAVFVAFYAIWSLIRTANIVSAALSLGQISISGSEYDILSVYMVNSFQYLAFAFLLAAAGLILQKIQKISGALVIPESETKVDIIIEDEEIDDFFSKNETVKAESGSDEEEE